MVHSPHYTMPLRVGRPVVVTVHDATFFTSPEVHTAVKGTFFRSATRTALRRASRVIVPSKATRDELIRVLDADPTAIDVAYHGVDTELFHPPSAAERDRVTARLGLHGQAYVAFLGTLEPRKNVPALIRGWTEAVKDRETPPALVLAGGSGWDDDVDNAVAGGALAPAGRPSRLPPFRGPAGLPRRGSGRGLPVLRRGFRPARCSRRWHAGCRC